MSKSSVLSILAAAGIIYAGPLSADAMALARAIQSGAPAQIERFISEYPESALRTDAIILASNQNGKGTAGNNGKGLGGSGAGNQGSNGKDVGNAKGWGY